MAGIYIHIPFCKQACTYCDFHFSTLLKYKPEMISAIIKEVSLSKDFLPQEKIETLYFGGGTPSLLAVDEVNKIIDAIALHYDLSQVKECTLEANPDDLSKTYLKALKDSPVNRLSIGIQSFQAADLSLMNRAHNATEAEYAIKAAQDIGISNLSCDLIFGTPTLNKEGLLQNLQKLSSWEVHHIAAYALTIEEKTALHHLVHKGKINVASDESYVEQMLMSMDYLSQQGYEQYEISNYARNKQYALHNTAYWQGKAYLGIGPSAHSFAHPIRRWNVLNNAQYLKAILQENKIPFEAETLTTCDTWNETILINFRTQWGLNLEEMQTLFGQEKAMQLEQNMQVFMEQNQILQTDRTFTLTTQGKLMADYICSQLFLSPSDFIPM